MTQVPARTSDSHPIFVDEIPLAGQAELADAAGRLGLTIAPGKHGPRALGGGIWKRDLDQDLARLKDVYGTDVLVSLMEDAEMTALHVADLPERAARMGMHVRRFPIRDVHTPREGETKAFDALIDDVVSDLASGRTVTVHCRGGLGRSGLVAACVLVHGGASPDDAIGLVRAHRKGAVETQEQAAYVHAYAARRAGSA